MVERLCRKNVQLRSLSLYDLESKLRKGGYMGDYRGDYYRATNGDIRSSDYSSYDPSLHFMFHGFVHVILHFVG